MTIASSHPGYLYRLEARDLSAKDCSWTVISDWQRDHEALVRRMNAEKANDASEGYRSEYKINCCSADWFA